MFSLFNFSSIFPGGQLTPFAPMCGRPRVDRAVKYGVSSRLCGRHTAERASQSHQGFSLLTIMRYTNPRTHALTH